MRKSGIVAMHWGNFHDYVSHRDVLTQHMGSSRLSQGCSAHSCLVEVEIFSGVVPPVRAFEPPAVEKPAA
jgi:biotin/methionine sulfoxide reductase